MKVADAGIRQRPLLWSASIAVGAGPGAALPILLLTISTTLSGVTQARQVQDALGVATIVCIAVGLAFALVAFFEWKTLRNRSPIQNIALLGSVGTGAVFLMLAVSFWATSGDFTAAVVWAALWLVPLVAATLAAAWHSYLLTKQHSKALIFLAPTLTVIAFIAVILVS